MKHPKVLVKQAIESAKRPKGRYKTILGMAADLELLTRDHVRSANFTEIFEAEPGRTDVGSRRLSTVYDALKYLRDFKMIQSYRINRRFGWTSGCAIVLDPYWVLKALESLEIGPDEMRQVKLFVRKQHKKLRKILKCRDVRSFWAISNFILRADFCNWIWRSMRSAVAGPLPGLHIGVEIHALIEKTGLPDMRIVGRYEDQKLNHFVLFERAGESHRTLQARILKRISLLGGRADRLLIVTRNGNALADLPNRVLDHEMADQIELIIWEKASSKNAFLDPVVCRQNGAFVSLLELETYLKR